MDDVDRMYRHLVRTLRATAPQLLTQPFQVGDLYSTILPYRLHRRELGLETNQDYEMAMLELLSGGRSYLVVEDRMRDELGASLRSPNPDSALIRDFAQSRVALAPPALQALDQEGQAAGRPTEPEGASVTNAAPRKEPDTAPFRAAASTAPSSAPAAGAAAASAASSPSTSDVSRASGASAGGTPGAGTRKLPRPIAVSPTGEQCRHCKGELPAGREIVFCPHCGQDLTVLHCPACGSELEHGWKFCVTCGRTAAGV
ncbi:MAG: zinc ribbon domain-containing protein [bacterium]